MNYLFAIAMLYVMFRTGQALNRWLIKKENQYYQNKRDRGLM
jgi:hypothetical protein